MQTMRTQLAVIGGGPAGVCAAIAAAQRGVQTALVTDRPVLGGNSSSEIHVWTRGATGAGNLWAEEMGVWGELKLENLYRNSDANPVFRDETLLDAVLREKNLTLLLNTEIYEVELDGGRVAALRGVQQSSERQFHIEADYFIDATVSAKAGVPFSVGNGNHETLGNSILYYTRREDHPVSFIAPDYAYDMSHIEKILGCGGRIINESRAEIVDDDAMLAAIASGRVGKYVTDFPNEKVVGVDNIIALPHLGACTPESEEKSAVMAARELYDYLANGNIKNSVNFPDATLERMGVSRVCILHQNVPTMLNQFLEITCSTGLNVENMINKAYGAYAYAMIDLNGRLDDDQVEKIDRIPEVIRVRVV